MPRKSSMFWNDRAMPTWATLWGARPTSETGAASGVGV